MAGSMYHVIEDGRYTGPDLGAENLGDAVETIEELVFVLLATTTDMQRAEAIARLYRCKRGEEPWPVWWSPDPVLLFPIDEVEG